MNLGKIRQLVFEIQKELDSHSNPKVKSKLPSLEEMYGEPEVEILSMKDHEILSDFFSEIEGDVEDLVSDDKGSSVGGNCIYIYVKKPKAKKEQKVCVYNNDWTQSEQPEALKKMIKLAEKEFPEYKGCIYYEAGWMD